MAAENYILLERIELNASAASVTFANIPQSGYTDLKIAMSAITTGGTQNCSIALNGSTSNFSQKQLGGDGSSAYSASRTDNLNVVLANGTGYTANVAASNEIYIPNYLSSVAKSFSTESATENNATGADLVMRAHLWNPGTQAAISSVTIYAANGSGSFGAYSTFSLYGLAAVGTTPAIAPKAAGGNRIDYDGTYWYHTFLASGTFTPQITLSCDALVVAGGGSGAYSSPGGGGAGGLIYSTAQSFATAQTITVGAGGAASGTGAVNGNIGNNSQIGSLTAAVGGGRGGTGANAGGNGGSGGGAGQSSGTGGTATSGQGFNGGGNNGGGGGAGAAGATGYGASGTGIGGVGLYYDAFGAATNSGEFVASHYYYAGGGGGYGTGPAVAAGGYGGGKIAGGAAGTVNTGGASGADSNAAGGSGVVIIRYLAA